MELSTELFDETIRRLKAQAPYGEQSKRTHPRLGLRYRMRIVQVTRQGLGARMDVWTRDISRSGVGVISAKRIEAGERFILLLPRAQDEAPLSLMCIVRNCNDLSGGCFGIGASFEAQGRGAVAGNSPAGNPPAAA